MHTAVLLTELVDNLIIDTEGIYIDCTGGGGSHSALILSKLSANARLIILDRDIEAVNRLKERFIEDKRVTVTHSNFSNIINILADLNIDKVDGICADFGVSSFQLKSAERGFSFQVDSDIDMRMDRTDGITAAEVVNRYSESDLTKIIRRYGEEQFAPRIARFLIERREKKIFIRTRDLADVISNAIPKKYHKVGLNPATKTFQALRIYVNKELEEVESLMKAIASIVKVGGRFVAISFHSLEDRIVKQSLHEYEKSCICPHNFPICVCGKKQIFKILTKKPITARKEELEQNPLSRSAKMRVGARV